MGYFSFFRCDGIVKGTQQSMPPQVCLCCEVCCCHSCALSSTRFYIMDSYSIVSDPCDNRILRFNNFMQCLSLILSILAIFIEELRDTADIVRFIANLVYLIVSGCMTAQMHHELDERLGPGQNAPKPARAPPGVGDMDRGINMQQQQQQQQQQSEVPIATPVRA